MARPSSSRSSASPASARSICSAELRSPSSTSRPGSGCSTRTRSTPSWGREGRRLAGPSSLREIEPTLPADLQVQTMTEQAAENGREVTEFVCIFRTFLLAFGGIALFVGAFVIFNTLSITVAQRSASSTLRTLGASRQQVLRSVVLEFVVVGALASIVGLFAGLGIAKASTRSRPPAASTCRRRRSYSPATAVVRPRRAGTPIALPASLVAGDSRHTRRAHRGSRGRGHASVPVRALRAAGLARRHGGCRRPLLLRRVRERPRHEGVTVAPARRRRLAAVRRRRDGRSTHRPPLASVLGAPGRGSAAAPASSPVRTRCGTRPGRRPLRLPS